MMLASEIMFHTPGLRSLLTWFVLVSKKEEKMHVKEIQVFSLSSLYSTDLHQTGQQTSENLFLVAHV